MSGWNSKDTNAIDHRHWSRKCIDSNTQVMVMGAARIGDTVICGNCGKSVRTYVRPGDTNKIPFIVAHEH